ncbi:syncoilin [Protopterus annectens]|uniref:syncoilin n=1 Tax=Protopterus annectens TaxID=7888 RepID=UPI001CFA8424|nr:syncoilin [Protopterus annectens]
MNDDQSTNSIFQYEMDDVQEIFSHVVPGTLDLLEETGQHFQLCIDRVEHLQTEKDDLIQQIVLLKEPTYQGLKNVREELLAAHKMKAKVELECEALKEEIRIVKRLLFKATRECIGCQYELETERHDIAQFAITYDELQQEAHRLEEELVKLKEVCEQQQDMLMYRLAKAQNVRWSQDLSDCRRLSINFENFLQENLQTVENYYEPHLIRLLKRREISETALIHAQEEAQNMKKKLIPLQEEMMKLSVQKKCLEEELHQKKSRRKEEVLHYRENIEELEEHIRKLRTEVQLQKKRNEEIETLRKSLSQELSNYKGCLDVYTQLLRSQTGTAK